MAETVEQEKPFVFVFPPPTAVRVLLFAFAAFFLAMALVLVFKLLLNNALESTVNFAIWALFAGFAAGIAFFMRLAFPSSASSAKLEIDPSFIRFTPRRVMRLIGEQSEEMHISPQSTEILLCRTYSQGLSQGTRIISCGPAGDEGEIKVDYLVILNTKNLQKLTDGITAATGLSVRKVIRRFPVDGKPEEAPWKAPQGATRWLSILGLGLAVLPYAAGITVGWIRPAPVVMVAAGLALWLICVSATYFIAHREPSKPKFPAANMFMTVFTFAAGYAASLVITIFVFRSR